MSWKITDHRVGHPERYIQMHPTESSKKDQYSPGLLTKQKKIKINIHHSLEKTT